MARNSFLLVSHARRVQGPHKHRDWYHSAYASHPYPPHSCTPLVLPVHAAGANASTRLVDNCLFLLSSLCRVQAPHTMRTSPLPLHPEIN